MGFVAGLFRKACRNRVIRKRMPADLGGHRVFCSPDAMLSMLKPGWRSDQARHLFRWARLLVGEGDVVWDIGANQGLFAFAAAARAGEKGEIVAFEPDPFLVGLMARTLGERSGGANVVILPVAVGGGEVSLEEFLIAGKDRALNHLASSKGNPRTGGARCRTTVLCCPLDWLAERLSAPALIKIDVEGAEAAVLRSAEGLLSGARPLVIVEVAEECSAEIAEILRKHRYRMLDAIRQGGEILQPAWNTLAIPEEKFAEIEAR